MASPEESSSPVPEIRAQLAREKVIEALAKAHPTSVQFCRKALVDYHPVPSDDTPFFQYTASFRRGDYIHFKLQHDPEWWIGRIVGHESGMVFIPSEEKLRSIAEELDDSGGQKRREDQLEVYERAPIIRPVVLVGPSSKTSQLTELLHKPIVSFIKEQFSGRLVVIKPDFSVDSSMTTRHRRRLEGEVAAAGVSMNLIFLECDANFPEDLIRTNIHPHIVYIQIARRKVLEKLINQMTANSRERQSQLEDAYRLYESTHDYSLVVSDSNVDDACLSVELFMESYWAATRSVILAETVQATPPQTVSKVVLTKQTTIDPNPHGQVDLV